MMLARKEDEMRYLKAGLEKQAEISYDKRQKLRDERIKTYFDSQVMKYLISHNSKHVSDLSGERNPSVDQDMVELTRQFCNLQIELDHAKQRNEQIHSENDGNIKIVEE